MPEEAFIVMPMFICGVLIVYFTLSFRHKRQLLDHAEALKSLELGLPLPPRPISTAGNVYSLPLFLLGGGIGVGSIVVLNGEPAAWGIMALLCLPGVGLLLALKLNAPRYKEELERARQESESYRKALTDRLEHQTRTVAPLYSSQD
ncbi:MAG: hypothetical protein KDC10_03005 [Calditrichaeota bacterium]|nr:hypothetical protein [Candidatus Cloacimonadota bacterium]MCA9786206.1 hypothetical protein [Candidatus Cloacimonadota bacterium]MCB1046147.1 hypothetical protein [Calditrichota bacterium]MCB9473031.1 hypothetical protein [Candidatus Delongbacteria bacterium]